jgi:hypothetical protein
MKCGKDHRGRSDFAVFASAVTFLISGACGRTGWRNPPVDAQGGRDLGVTIGHDAIAVASCSPNDATAVSIKIGVDRPSCDSTSSGSFIVVAIWYTSWDYLKPGTYALDANGAAGLFVYSPAQGVTNGEDGTNTVLTIKSIDSGWMIGHLESSFPSGRGSVDFTAQWCAGNPMCG